MKVSRIHTESGSVYDVDLEGKQIRRVHGRHGPADTQPQDGIWRNFAAIEGPVVDTPMVVYWAPEAAAGAKETNLGFRSTVVRAVDEIELGPDEAPDPV